MFEAQIDLELAFTEDLYEFLKATSDIVGVGELIELALNLLCLIETQFLVGPHRSIVSISVLMSTYE